VACSRVNFSFTFTFIIHNGDVSLKKSPKNSMCLVSLHINLIKSVEDLIYNYVYLDFKIHVTNNAKISYK
jgi:hypothetical protein